MKNQPAFPTGLIAKKTEMAGGRYEGTHVTQFAAAHDGMSLRAYLAAHACTDDIELFDQVLELRAERATYTGDPPTVDELAEAIADIKVKIADAIIRRLAREAL